MFALRDNLIFVLFEQEIVVKAVAPHCLYLFLCIDCISIVCHSRLFGLAKRSIPHFFAPAISMNMASPQHGMPKAGEGATLGPTCMFHLSLCVSRDCINLCFLCIFLRAGTFLSFTNITAILSNAMILLHFFTGWRLLCPNFFVIFCSDG